MTEQDIRALTEALQKLEPGFLPYPIFEQVARLVALPILEFVPLRWCDDHAEVLLIERDPVYSSLWPGQLHTPGTVIRATDLHQPGDTNWAAFDRITQDEMQCVHISDPHYVGSILHASKRGTEQAQLYWVEVLGEPAVGSFYPIDHLPSNVMESQITLIQQAHLSFTQYHLGQPED